MHLEYEWYQQQDDQGYFKVIFLENRDPEDLLIFLKNYYYAPKICIVRKLILSNRTEVFLISTTSVND